MPRVELAAVSGDGTIYYAWSPIQPDHSSRLYLTSSSDGGVTWPTPKLIRESIVPMAATNVAVAPDNTVGVLRDVVNTAARLQGKVLAGQVIVSESVYRKVEDRYPDAEMTKLTMRGKATPVSAWVLSPTPPDR